MACLSKALPLIIFLLFGFSEARVFLVGGKRDAWTIPSSSSQAESLNQWAQNSRFRIGDILVWNYDRNKDSVLQVTEEGYGSCNTSKAIEEYTDGNTRVKLEKAGPHYFISGAKGHCEQGQKVTVVVVSPRQRFVLSPALAPTPTEFKGPAVAPTSGAINVQAGLVVGLGIFWIGFVVIM